MMRKLRTSKMNMPKVVVTDRDTALMNAVANVLPESYAMNYYIHVQKNVKARCILDCRYPLEKRMGKR